MRPRKPRSPCPACGQPVENLRSLYCTNKCQQEFQYRAYIERWKAGLERGGSKLSEKTNPGCIMSSSYVRRYLFEKFGSVCTRCGWAQVNPVTGKVPLQVEHLDGDPLNNREENLDLICPNCHSLTSTYGNLNRGRGREKRLKEVLGL